MAAEHFGERVAGQHGALPGAAACYTKVSRAGIQQHCRQDQSDGKYIALAVFFTSFAIRNMPMIWIAL